MRPAIPTARHPRGRFDIALIALHWLTAALVLAQIATGLSLDALEGGAAFAPVLALHRTMGASVWALTFLRALWRLTLARFPHFPATMGRAHRAAVGVGEFALYALLFVQPATGLAATLLRGQPFLIFAVTVPPLLPRMTDLSLAALTLHRWGAWAFIVLLSGHIAAALVHHRIARDDILVAMAPWLARRRAEDDRSHFVLDRSS